ncbi:MAG TPA: hypothetical protein VH600_23435, partial [Burkholderiales bacterium]
MAALPDIELSFTKAARAKADAFLASITDYSPILCIMKGHNPPEPALAWTLGAYGPKNIESLAPEYQRLGRPLLYLADGMTVAIPQYQFVNELVGKTFALDGKG